MSELLIKSILSDYGNIAAYTVRQGLIYVTLDVRRLTREIQHEMQSRLNGYGFQVTLVHLSSNTSSGILNDRIDLVINSFGGESQNQYIEPELFKSDVRKRKWTGHPVFHIALFLITFTIVFITGAATIINREITGLWDWWIGFQYAFALMAILTAHEFGHYFAARYHGLKVTLPYFLPGILIPPWIIPGFGGTTIMPGTFGAFIRIKSPIETRKQLMDVGAAGPIAGFVVCLIVLILGFVFIPPNDYAYQFYDVMSLYDGQPVTHFGSSLLFSTLGALLAPDKLPAMYDIVHYPLLFAGWFGLLVTALNLLPIGQLDGGHVLYSLLGRKQKYVAVTAFAFILFIAFFYDIKSWFIWAILIIFIIRIKHPPVVDEDTPLDRKRILVGIIAIIIFILCFIPAPIYDKNLTAPAY